MQALITGDGRRRETAVEFFSGAKKMLSPSYRAVRLGNATPVWFHTSWGALFPQVLASVPNGPPRGPITFSTPRPLGFSVSLFAKQWMLLQGVRWGWGSLPRTAGQPVTSLCPWLPYPLGLAVAVAVSLPLPPALASLKGQRDPAGVARCWSRDLGTKRSGFASPIRA